MLERSLVSRLETEQLWALREGRINPPEWGRSPDEWQANGITLWTGRATGSSAKLSTSDTENVDEMTVERPKIPVDRRFKSDRPHTFPPASIDIIASEVRSCSLCPLADARILAVPGEGPPDARIVLVGEAPGREEDRSGSPFVGRAGRLLDSVLESVGLTRSEIFVTNVVKCRPPKNRLPFSLETKTCIDAHLLRQLGSIDPQLVVLLGRTAARTLLEADSLAQVRGKILRRGKIGYLSTYHPAAVLRNPKLRATLTKDLRKIRPALAG